MKFILRGMDFGFRFMSVLFFGMSMVFWCGHIFGLQLLPEYAFKTADVSNVDLSAGGVVLSVICFVAAWLVDRVAIKLYNKPLEGFHGEILVDQEHDVKG